MRRFWLWFYGIIGVISLFGSVHAIGSGDYWRIFLLGALGVLSIFWVISEILKARRRESERP